MKKIWIVTLLACFACNARAVEVSLTHQLTSQANVSWKYVEKYSSQVKCYPFGKADSTRSLGGENLVANSSADQTGSDQWYLQSNQGITIGQVDLSLSKHVISPLHENYLVNLVDNVNWSSYQNKGDSDCVSREYHWRVNSHRIYGNYTINITMPKNAWVLRLEIHVTGQGAPVIENGKAIRITGDFHNAPVRVDEPIYVWAKPGSQIHIPFNIDINSSGGLQSSVNVDIEQLKLGANANLMNELERQLNNFNSIKTDGFLKLGGSIAGNPRAAKSVVANLGLKPLMSITRKLFAIAQGSFPDNPDELPIKAMAAAMDYQIALAVLNNLKVFCDTKAIYLPFKNETISRPGFIIANFWLNQNVSRLRALNFPEVRAFLDELIRWQNDGLKYSDIAHNTADFDKMRDGYMKVRRTSELAWDVFSDIKGSLEKITSTFGTVGTDQATINDLFAELNDLSAKRAALNLAFEKLAFSFTYDNHKAIDASDVLNMLQSLEDETNDLARKMNATLKFVSISTNGTTSNVVTTMADLLSHEVNVFSKKLNSSYAEPIRMAFQQSEETKQLQDSFYQCLGVKK